MDIYEYLRNDHQKVADLMERVINNDIPEQRATLYETIKHELKLHAETEEDTFYKAIDKATNSNKIEDDLDHAHGEHEEIRECLENLDKTNYNEPLWMTHFLKLKEKVTHHVKEEEGEVFDDAKRVLSDTQARDLAILMDHLKQVKIGKKSAA